MIEGTKIERCTFVQAITAASSAALSLTLLPQRAVGQILDKITSIASDQFETGDNTLREALTSLEVRKWRRFNARSMWPAFKSGRRNHRYRPSRWRDPERAARQRRDPRPRSALP